MFARRKRTVPQLNATSTADISFMLLIFFLVTTSMDLDKGLGKKLPPVEKSKQEESLVHKDNIIKVFITADNKIVVDDVPSSLDDLKTKLKSLVSYNYKLVKMPITTPISMCKMPLLLHLTNLKTNWL